MNENLIKTDWTFTKEVDRYNDSIDNYQIPNELMVTITLNEYRRLLTAEATARAKEAEANKYNRESKIRELEQKLKEAESKIELYQREDERKIRQMLCEKCGKKEEVAAE